MWSGCGAWASGSTSGFRENEIDETVLPSLTAEHLKDLGVTALGHRVKLLEAIAALRNETSGKTPSVDAATTSSAPSPHPEDRAERRQVTVMFSDLIGSTALRRAWTLKTSAKSFRPTRSASRRPCSVSEASLRSTWATVCSCISVIPRPMRTMRSGPVWAGLQLSPRPRDDGARDWRSRPKDWRCNRPLRTFLTVTVDISARRAAEDALRAAQSELGRIARLTTVGAMAATIAHELNQPLAAIVSNGNAGLRWLDRPEPNLEEARSAFGRVVNKGHRAALIITSIRAMFKKD